MWLASRWTRTAACPQRLAQLVIHLRQMNHKLQGKLPEQLQDLLSHQEEAILQAGGCLDVTPQAEAQMDDGIYQRASRHQ